MRFDLLLAGVFCGSALAIVPGTGLVVFIVGNIEKWLRR